MLTKYHGHPISVHIPNGLLPVTVLLIILSALFGIKGMATAATYNLGAVALSMPLVLFLGWVDWQNRFNGAITDIFIVKIACGIIVTVTAWFLFIWLLVNPAVGFHWSVTSGGAGEVSASGSAVLHQSTEQRRAIWASGVFEYDLDGFFGSPDNEEMAFAECTITSALLVGPGHISQRYRLEG